MIHILIVSFCLWRTVNKEARIESNLLAMRQVKKGSFRGYGVLGGWTIQMVRMVVLNIVYFAVPLKLLIWVVLGMWDVEKRGQHDYVTLTCSVFSETGSCSNMIIYVIILRS